MERLRREEARRRFEPAVSTAIGGRCSGTPSAGWTNRPTPPTCWQRRSWSRGGGSSRCPTASWSVRGCLAVARRALANERRSARRRHALAERLGRELATQVPKVGASPDGAGADGARVRQALERLSEEDREVLLLAGWEELAPAQIAVVLGVRAVTARSRLHRARRRLRAELDADGGAAGATDRRRRSQTLDLTPEEAR